MLGSMVKFRVRKSEVMSYLTSKKTFKLFQKTFKICVMNFLKLNRHFISFRSFATAKRYVPETPYRSVFNRNLPPKTRLDRDTIEILEKLSLVGKITKENVKIIEDAIAFADVILQVDTKNVVPVYTVLEDWYVVHKILFLFEFQLKIAILGRYMCERIRWWRIRVSLIW